MDIEYTFLWYLRLANDALVGGRWEDAQDMLQAATDLVLEQKERE